MRARPAVGATAKRAQSLCASSIRIASSCDCQIRPQASAVGAGRGSASSASARARAGPTRRGSIHVPPESGTRPILANDWMKLAERAAITMSQARAMLQPAPAATPLTAATTGKGSALSLRTNGL